MGASKESQRKVEPKSKESRRMSYKVVECPRMSKKGFGAKQNKLLPVFYEKRFR